jgi:WD40 repeat protein
LVAAIFLAVGSTVSIFFAIEARFESQQSRKLSNQMKSANNDLERSRRSLNSRVYASDLALAQASLERGDAASARLLLDRYSSDGRRGFEWHYLNRLARGTTSPLEPEDQPLKTFAISPDGRLVAMAVLDKIAIRDLRTLQLTWFTWRRESDVGDVNTLTFSPDSSLLALFCDGAPPRLFSCGDGTPTGPSFDPVPNPINYPLGVWSPDGLWVAAASGESPIYVWDAANGRLVASFPAIGLSDQNSEGIPPVQAMAFHIKGQESELRLYFRDQTYDAWEIPSGEPLGSGCGPPYDCRAAAFTPNGDHLLVIDQVGIGQLLALDSKGSEEDSIDLPPFGVRPKQIVRAAISNDGQSIAAGLSNGTVLVANRYNNEFLSLNGHDGPIEKLAFHPDGRRVLSSTYAGHLFLRDPILAHPWRILETDGVIQNVAFTSDCRSLIAQVVYNQPDGDGGRFGGPEWLVRWDLASGRATRVWRSDVVGYWRLSPAGDRFVRFSHTSHVYALEEASENPRVLPVSIGPLGVAFAFDPNGRYLGFQSENKEGEGLQFRIVDTETGKAVDLDPLLIPPLRFDYAELALGPNGLQVAAFADRSPDIAIWDGTNGRIVRRLSLREHQGYRMKFDPTGKWLAVGCIQGETLVWNLQSDKDLPLVLQRSNSTIQELAFTPDGRLLAVAGTDEVVAFWDLEAHQEIATFRDTAARSLAFSPDGGFLAIVLLNGKIRLLDARPSSPEVLASREAAALLDFHLDPDAAVQEHISDDDPLDRSACDRVRAVIESDFTITDDVRRKALELLEPASRSYEVRRVMRAAIAIHHKGWDRLSRTEARAAALLEPSPLQDEILRQLAEEPIPSPSEPFHSHGN